MEHKLINNDQQKTFAIVLKSGEEVMEKLMERIRENLKKDIL